MKRPLTLLVAIVAVASVGAGCSSGGGVASTLNDAATMSYTLKGKHHTLHVSRARLLSEMRSLVDNKPFAAFLKEQSFTVSKDLSADSKLTAIWLTQLIQQETIDSLFASRHLHVTSAQRKQATTDAAGFFPGETIFPAFSKKFQDTLIERQARSIAVAASYTHTSDTAGKAYFAAHQAEFGCPSGKEVAHILVTTQTAADAIVAQLAAGGSFETIAKEKSTDTGSAQNGGSVGCLAAGTFVPAFQSAAEKAPFGTPVGPVHTQFGYHVILVTKATAPTYESSRTKVLDALKQKGAQDFSAAVTDLFKRFKKVHLDPRFGTWGLTPNGQGQPIYQVTPPKAPTPATSRDGTTTTVTVPAAATPSP
jgi:hypothetical protein